MFKNLINVQSVLVFVQNSKDWYRKNSANATLMSICQLMITKLRSYFILKRRSFDVDDWIESMFTLIVFLGLLMCIGLFSSLTVLLLTLLNYLGVPLLPIGIVMVGFILFFSLAGR